MHIKRLFLILPFFSASLLASSIENPLKIIISHAHTSGRYIRECAGDCVFKPEDKLHFFIEDTQIFPDMIIKQQGALKTDDVTARDEGGKHFLNLKFRRKIRDEQRRTHRKFKLMEMDFKSAKLEPGEYFLMFPTLQEGDCVTSFRIKCEEQKHLIRKTETLCEFIRDPILLPL